ncbi:MAG: hypothetical protein JSW58_04390 [Candidatus Latescibacterota bacterium]|nr:MAG: hypothetical protein JSW58_04390 [Candidatus Latescibacterota bacterium]
MRLRWVTRVFRIACVIVITGVIVFGCSDDTTCPCVGSQPTWSLPADSMNLAVLVSDYLTYEFERGALNHYPMCSGCDEEGLPFEIVFDPPLDFGDITFRYTERGDTLFRGTIVWMGTGAITYPTEFFDADEFERVSDPRRDPLSTEYFSVYPQFDEETFKAKADSAWQEVKTLDIVADFARKDYRVGVYMYPPTVGMFDPSVAKWVVFLYRGKVEI